MNIDKQDNFVVGHDNKPANGFKLLVIPDWRSWWETPWINNKPVQVMNDRWIEGGSAPPKRPSTFMDRSKWKGYHREGKDFDPWEIFLSSCRLSKGLAGKSCRFRSVSHLTRLPLRR